MPIIQENAMVPYPHTLMYRVVDDVENYPKFLPYCCGAEWLDRSIVPWRARLDFSHSGWYQSLVTCNHRVKDHSIEITLVSGPLHRLNGHWQFRAISPQSCQVDFRLYFEFKGIFGFMLNSWITSLLQQQWVAFCCRADQLAQAGEV